MNSSSTFRAVLIGAGVCVGALSIGQFQQRNLVSDGWLPADHIDVNLVNTWGVAFSPTGPFWVANNGTATSTVYDAAGNPFPIGNPLIVSVPPTEQSTPTGMVFNGGSGFVVNGPNGFGPSRFIFATEDGTIAGWNPTADPANAVIAVTRPSANTKFKGLAISRWIGRDFIYATNFLSGMVEMYDDQFRHVYDFRGPRLPRDYAPFGIQAIGQYVVVTYAKRGPTGDDVKGHGNGFVDLFLPTGHFVKRLISHGQLNSPWGIALAPDTFGEFGGDLLIGNFGDGRINAYQMGHFAGTLRDSQRRPIEIEGLWGLIFGNGGNGGDPEDLYFTAGPGDEQHGLFGEISFQGN